MDPAYLGAQKELTQASRLRFTVVGVSSEDEGHPASQLASQSPQTRGWSSAGFCEYPQELLFKLDGVSMVQRLQILSHQSRISSKIEIYAGVEPSPSMKRLGYMSLDTNERSEFKARELKTVQLNFKAQYIRLIFHKCHINRYNLYNQVGLVAVSFLGYPLTSYETSEKIQRSQSAELRTIDGSRNPGTKRQPMYDLMYDINFDPATAESIRMLEKEKDRSIQQEDYDEAKKIKLGIEYLKQIGIDIAKMESRKAEAVDNEDFDGAKILKMEIDQMRTLATQKMKQYQLSKYIIHYGGREKAKEARPSSALEEPYAGLIPKQDQLARPPSRKLSAGSANRPQQVVSEPPPAQPVAEAPPPQPKEPINPDDRPIQPKSNPAYIDPDDRPIKPRKDSGTPQDDADANGGSDPFRNTSRKTPVQDRPIRPAQGVTFSDDSDGTDGTDLRSSFGKMKVDSKKPPMKPGLASPKLMGSKEPITAKPGDLPEPEPLSSTVQKESKFIINIFGERTVRCLYSRIWNLRAMGIDEIKEGLITYEADQLSIFKACCKVLPKLLNDTTSMISLKALELFISLVAFSSKLPSSEVLSGLEAILPIVVSKTSDTNAKTREKAVDSVVLAATTKNVSGTFVSPFVLDMPSNANPKIIKGRMIVLEQLVRKIKLAKNSGLTVQNVMTFCVPQLTHSSEEIRSLAMKVIAELYIQVGESKLQPFLKDQKPATIAALKTVYEDTERNHTDDQYSEEEEDMKSSQRTPQMQMKMSRKPPTNPRRTDATSSVGENSRVDTEDESDFEVNEVKKPAASGTKASAPRPKSRQRDESDDSEDEDDGRQDIYINIKLVPNRDRNGGYNAIEVNPGGMYNPTNQIPYGAGASLGYAAGQNLTASFAGNSQKTSRPSSQQKLPPLDQPNYDSQDEPHTDEDAPLENSCPLCHIDIPENNEDKLDNHYKFDCPMMTECPECQELTEIPLLDIHLLEDCAKKEKYEQCQTCFAVVASNLMKIHTPKCKPLKHPNDVACPLCHGIVQNDGWEKHLMVAPGCPKNPRTKKMKTEYEEAKLKSVVIAKPLTVSSASNRAGPTVKSARK